jgi:hypothetical protein
MKRLFSIFIICFGNFTSTFACTVPVFRYALEQWPQDTYRMFLFVHKTADFSELMAAQSIAAKAMSVSGKLSYLKNYTQSTVKSNFDLNVMVVDDTLTLGAKRLLGHHEKGAFPFVIMMLPEKTQSNQIVFKGPLKDVPSELFDSPARHTIQDRISGGESIVWVLVESGDKKKDETAALVLQKEIEKCKTKIRFSEQDSSELAKLSAGSKLELKIDFSMFRISRSDPKEKLFISILEKTYPKPAHFADEPVVYPVFARGRVLHALVGKGINEKNIFEAASFLTGPCACTVKDQNPGADLLMTFDWNSILKGNAVVKESVPPLVGLGSLLSASPNISGVSNRAANDSIITESAEEATSDTSYKRIESTSGTGLILKTNGEEEPDKKQDQLLKEFIYPFAGICLFGFLFVTIASIRMNGKKQK